MSESAIKYRAVTRVAVRAVHEARLILERDGWCQGFAQNEMGEHCAAGAIRAAIEGLRAGLPEEREAEMLLIQALVKRCRVGVPTLTQYNDRPGRTVEEVLSLFTEAVQIGTQALMESAQPLEGARP